MKTSHAVTLSSCGLFAGGLVGGKGDGFVVVLAGGQAVVEAADEAVEQVALGGDGLCCVDRWRGSGRLG
jgi:hypothetical protein